MQEVLLSPPLATPPLIPAPHLDSVSLLESGVFPPPLPCVSGRGSFGCDRVEFPLFTEHLWSCPECVSVRALHPWRLKRPSLHSGQGVVKLDVQPKCLAVGPGGYTVVVCIGQVRLQPGSHQKFGLTLHGTCSSRPSTAVHPVFTESSPARSEGLAHVH